MLVLNVMLSVGLLIMSREFVLISFCILFSSYFLSTEGNFWSEDSQDLNKMDSTNNTITIVGNDFMVDGQPLQIISGSFHYFRTPGAYWRDRLRKMKVAGLNTVSTYVEWNFHEPEHKDYNFKGDRNVAKFIRMAAEEGLYVLLRPGPYIGADRDLGGLPYWLLGKFPNIKLRTTDINFIRKTEIWMKKLFKILSPLLFGNGGPIIMVQVECEYGSFGDDILYKKTMRDIILKHVSNKALLFTSDGRSLDDIVRGAVPGAIATVNFGYTKDVIQEFSQLRSFMPVGPLMNSNFFIGTTAFWGGDSLNKNNKDFIRVLKDMLYNNINFNIHMFCGGTNFEFTAGAHYRDHHYEPVTTSYDYDAPISESGDLTNQYYEIRNTIMEFKQEVFNPTSRPSPKGNYGTVILRPRFNLLSPEGRAALGKVYANVSDHKLPTFESLRQRSGLVLYETAIEEGIDFLLIRKPRDLVYVYIDGVLEGTVRNIKKKLYIPITSKNNSVLSLLVENQGRNSEPSPPIHDRKGILGKVEMNYQTLNGTWRVTGFPLEKLNFSSPYNAYSPISHGAVIFEARFTITDDEVLDTFLDTSGWGKGYVWINGHNLGRYWSSSGPQMTLYVPAIWLKSEPEQNYIVVLELETPGHRLTMSFIDYPILKADAAK